MLKDWNVEFAKDLNAMNGRVLPQEKIYQKDSQVSEWCACLCVCWHCCLLQLRYDPATADWSRGMRGNHLISAVGLQVRVCVFFCLCMLTYHLLLTEFYGDQYAEGRTVSARLCSNVAKGWTTDGDQSGQPRLVSWVYLRYVHYEAIHIL